jgi:tyrosine-protein phosphatase SIW14
MRRFVGSSFPSHDAKLGLQSSNQDVDFLERMPTMRASVRFVFAAAIALFVVAGPLYYRSWHQAHWRNFRVVEAGKLYRSAQLPISSVQRIVNDYGIRTIVCLREGDKAEDKREEAWAADNRVKFVRIPPRSWSMKDGTIDAEIGLAEFRKVMNDPANHPVLIHCYAGIHRTGSYVAVYRMDYQGWSNETALAEMKAMGYDTFDSDGDVRPYLQSYRPDPSRTTREVPARAVSREK